MEVSLPRSNAPERRKEPRYTTQQPAVAGISDSGVSFAAHILDVSRSGVRLQTNEWLAVSAGVSLQMGGLDVQGLVCRCERNKNGTFDIGVTILEVSRPCSRRPRVEVLFSSRRSLEFGKG
jgi:hypothetical protein